MQSVNIFSIYRKWWIETRGQKDETCYELEFYQVEIWHPEKNKKPHFQRPLFFSRRYGALSSWRKIILVFVNETYFFHHSLRKGECSTKRKNVVSCRKMEEQSSLTNCHTGGDERRYRPQDGEKEKQTIDCIQWFKSCIWHGLGR